ncbi:MAG: hypothetical protein JXB47_20165 [Anaerolineae bacterium]|nr:hypothetical protein [Anaerolineae bacterium]
MGYVFLLAGEEDKKSLPVAQSILQAAGLSVKTHPGAMRGAPDVVLLLAASPLDPAALDIVRSRGARLYPLILEAGDVAIPDGIPAPVDLRDEREAGKKLYDLLRALRKQQRAKRVARRDEAITPWLERKWLRDGRILAYSFKCLPDLPNLQQYFLPDLAQMVFAWQDGAYPCVLIDLRPVGMLRLAFSTVRWALDADAGDEARFAEAGAPLLVFLSSGAAAVALPGRCLARYLIRKAGEAAEAGGEANPLGETFRFFASPRQATNWLAECSATYRHK